MRWKVFVLIILLHVVPIAEGIISVDVYLADSNTLLPCDPNVPYLYRDIMLGTKLEIFVSSNIARNWSGSLALADANMEYGILSARDYNENTLDWKGSHFPAAGKEAVVWNWEESLGIYGFELHTGSTQISPGKWFVIDYVPTKVDICRLGFYDYDIAWYIPLYYLTFLQVRSRDFNNDARVDFADFAALSQHWLVSNCNEPNWCKGADLDLDGDVDIEDLSLFTSFWLAGTK